MFEWVGNGCKVALLLGSKYVEGLVEMCACQVRKWWLRRKEMLFG